MFYVYVHTNLINGKKYVGITKLKPEQRWCNGKGYTHNQYFTSAILKYGWNNFSHEIVYSNLTQKEAELKEQELINQYKSNNNIYGYNLTSGGRYCSMSDQTKEKISNSLKGRVVSRETISKISNTEKGKLVSIETRNRISNANKERFKSFEERYKCGSGLRGKQFPKSIEHRKNISKALKGKIWIHKDNNIKYIKPESLNFYLLENWKLGKKDKIIKTSRSMSEIKKGGHWICNKNNKTKYVYSSDLVLYLQKGWQLGRKFKNNS